MKITTTHLFARSMAAFARLAILLSVAALLACSPDMTPADYSKLPEFGSPQVTLYVEKCSECHAAPLPTVHPKTMWSAVVDRMQLRMTSKKVVPLNKQQQQQILDYLEKYGQ